MIHTPFALVVEVRCEASAFGDGLVLLLVVLFVVLVVALMQRSICMGGVARWCEPV